MSDFDVAGKQAGESTRTAPAWEERNTTPASLAQDARAIPGTSTAGVQSSIMWSGLF